MRFRHRLLTTLALCAFALVCTHREAKHINVVLISIDTLRADHLPAYGYAHGSTPHIDAFRRDAVLFRNAWSHCPMTLPSHVSMLTGLAPYQHEVRNNVGFTFDPQAHPTIAQRLHDRGYATGAAVSAYVLRGDTGLARAFDWYDDVKPSSAADANFELERAGTDTVRDATQWLASRDASQPFFLFVHLFEPHAPYAHDSYDGEITTADAAIGQLFDDLRARTLYDDALIILTSDHGEGLSDHGELQHSVFLYREAIHVPLLVKLPGRKRAGDEIATNVQHTDLAPTIASLTGLETPPHTLFAPAATPILSESLYPQIHLGWSAMYSAIAGEVHYIDAPKPELYDMRNDARETTNVIDAHRREAATLHAALAPLAKPAHVGPVSAEDAARLADLGYVGGPANREASHVNPRDEIASYEASRLDLGDGIALDAALARGDVAAAKERAERIASRPTPSAAGLALAAKAFFRAGDAPRALALCDRASKLSANVPQLGLTRGNALAALGRFDEAVRAYRGEIDAHRDELEAWATLAALQFAMNDRNAGNATLEAMVKANPSRRAALAAARTCAAVEDMNGAREWQRRAAQF